MVCFFNVNGNNLEDVPHYPKWNILTQLSSHTEQEYAKSTTVVMLEKATDTVVCQDFNGNLWCFYGIEDWQIGDVASLLMSDNGTENYIYDDIVLSARYDGY